MWETVEIAAKQINTEFPLAINLLDFIALNYQKITKRGFWRDSSTTKESFSPIGVCKGSNILKFQEADIRLKENKLLKRRNYVQKAKKLVETRGLPVKNICNLPGEKKAYYPKIDGADLTGVAHVELDNRNSVLIWHYPRSQIFKDKLLPRINELYSDIISPRKPKMENFDNTMEKLAGIHWLMVQGMPFKGGTGGISDAFMKTIMRYLNFKIPPYKRDVVPDMDVLTTPLEEYKKEFPKFFERSIL
ncbi:MAG: hypothetical protein A2Y25_07015 [Candidatus Melainabacteria bacterium GWF2_37_15]|nr:MAG: hypothetical protein A2Y25_07015 [Candidatus Melainabacteria bacterium GWF2_37_15]